MSYEFQNVSVLICEDNFPMMELVKSILKTFGVGSIYTAKNGEEGFQKFCQHNPDIVITDWMMTPVDGISFSRLIRNDKRSPNPLVPIILIAGFSEKKRVVQARDVGVHEFLVKPFNARDLYKRMVQIIEKPRDFVKSDDFFGPDRRRKADQAYDGPKRRDEDER